MPAGFQVTSWDTSKGKEREYKKNEGRSFIRCITQYDDNYSCSGGSNKDMGTCRMVSFVYKSHRLPNQRYHSRYSRHDSCLVHLHEPALKLVMLVRSIERRQATKSRKRTSSVGYCRTKIQVYTTVPSADQQTQDIIDSTMGNMGYDASESYGLTWKVRGLCKDLSNLKLFDKRNVYGDIKNSDIYGTHQERCCNGLVCCLMKMPTVDDIALSVEPINTKVNVPLPPCIALC